MPFAPKPDIPGKICKVCGAPLARKRYRNSLESYDRYLAREHCSQSCANTKSAVCKSAHHWRARKHCKSACEECGATTDLHVHHKDRNYENDDPSNLVTLCDSCHLKIHWREDREKRLAGNSMVAAATERGPLACEICGTGFRPRHRRIRTCSASCKSELLARSQPVAPSGYRGVYWDKARGKWQARVKVDGRWRSAGRFDSAEQAAAALRAVAEAGAA